MPGGSARREGVGSNDTSYTIIDLAPNTQYFVVVIAETEAGDGIASDNVTSTTGFGGEKWICSFLSVCIFH